MLNGLDLFSGIGGITKALEEWVRPIAYCDNDRFAQAVLLSRMASGELPKAPIWDDVKELNSRILRDFPKIDIIYGGFPCQDISTAGAGKGLGGKRSSLFYEIMRLAQEIKPTFLFLENVPAIRTRGLREVGKELATAGYDCRWDIVSAREMGAPHRRERWFCLAKLGYSKHYGPSTSSISRSNEEAFDYRSKEREKRIRKLEGTSSLSGSPFNTDSSRFSQQTNASTKVSSWWRTETPSNSTSWWSTEPNICRVANGIPLRVDRVKSLGNAVVPSQTKEAFMRLLGLKI